MRDLFDDFLEELRRREAIARGEDPDAGSPRRPKPVGPDPDDGGGDQPPPRELRRRRRGRSGPPWWAIGLGIFALILVLSYGLDLWTDALWFQSVGFDAVFWTRFTAQLGLFVVATIATLAIVLINVAIAGRLAKGTGDGRSPFRSWFERLNDAVDPRRAGGQWDNGGGGGARTVTFGPDDFPDLTPIAGAVLIGLAILIALTIGASIAASWSTILLWTNRVPFSPDTSAPVVDPIFGRDIGFFLFELPFLRLVQSLFNAIVIVTLLAVGLRYLVAASRGLVVFSRPSACTWASSPGCSCCRSRSATSSTSTSSCTARAASRPASPTPTRTRSSSRTTSSRCCPASQPRCSSGRRSPGCSGRSA
jgi:hypothetical protein